MDEIDPLSTIAEYQRLTNSFDSQRAASDTPARKLGVCSFLMTLAISIKNLRKTYANGFDALKGISLEVSEGDFFALLGPNGAGKSTTIGILSTLVKRSSGTVEVFGKNVDTHVYETKNDLLEKNDLSKNINSEEMMTAYNKLKIFLDKCPPAPTEKKNNKYTIGELFIRVL